VEGSPETTEGDFEDGEWQGVERDMNEIVSSSVHSSMAPIRVEIARTTDTDAALPWEGAE
jgi:hypothetical protein